MRHPWIIPLVMLISMLPAGCGQLAVPMHVGEIVEAEDGARVERILYDPGGAVRKGRQQWLDRQARQRIDRYVIDGYCGSLCAHMALADASTCYTDDAVLWMHPALMMALQETPATRRWTEWSVARWPAPWRRWWRENEPGALGVHLTAHDLREIAPEMECSQ